MLGQDWDITPTAIDQTRLRAFLCTAKPIAHIQDDRFSQDYLDEQRPVPLEDSADKAFLSRD